MKLEEIKITMKKFLGLQNLTRISEGKTLEKQIEEPRKEDKILKENSTMEG